MSAGPVLIVGAGYLGCTLADRWADAGDSAVLASRNRPSVDGAEWLPLDVRDAASCRRVVADSHPRAIVLVHGPSDITWCESHADEAMLAHVAGARNLVAAGDGIPTLMISTDNVFQGDRPLYVEDDPPLPANAYGRAKLAAETIVGESSHALVLRASLAYGWRRAGRANFFDDTARALARGREVRAPSDHWNTPVLARDIADWAFSLQRGGATGLVHLGGPDRVSRYEWALLIARELDCDPALVVPVTKQETGYACRPANACLGTARRIDALDGFAAAGVRDAIRQLRT